MQRCGRAGQAIQEITRRACGSKRSAGPLKAAGAPGRPEPEQDDARQPGEREQRLISGGQAEGGTVIDNELEPQQAASNGDPVPVAQGR